jgi:hypothetical protein
MPPPARKEIGKWFTLIATLYEQSKEDAVNKFPITKILSITMDRDDLGEKTAAVVLKRKGQRLKAEEVFQHWEPCDWGPSTKKPLKSK